MKFTSLISLSLLFGAASGLSKAGRSAKSDAMKRELKEKRRLNQDFMAAMHTNPNIDKARRKGRSQWEKERRDRLYEKLVKASKPVEELDDEARKLAGYDYNNGQYQGGQANYNYNGQAGQNYYQWNYQQQFNYEMNMDFDMAARSFKYAGCAAIKTYDEELASEDADPMTIDTYAVFRLCPSEHCNKYSMVGCGKNYGEYVVEMKTYLGFMLEYYEERYEDYCEYCLPCDWTQQTEAKNYLQMCYENLNEQEWQENQMAQQQAWEDYYAANGGDMAGYNQGGQYNNGNGFNAYNQYYNGGWNGNNNQGNMYNNQNNRNGNNWNAGGYNYNNNANNAYNQGNANQMCDPNQVNNAQNYNNAYNQQANNNAQNQNYNNGGNRKLDDYNYNYNYDYNGGNNNNNNNNAANQNAANQNNYNQNYNQNAANQNNYNGNANGNNQYYNEGDQGQQQDGQMQGQGFWGSDGVWYECDPNMMYQNMVECQDGTWCDVCEAENEQLFGHCDDYICQDYYTYCTNEYYGEVHQFDIFDFLECAEFQNDAGQQYFIGPHCGDNHFTISLGVFSDENCANYVGETVTLSQILGYRHEAYEDDDDLFKLPRECISCDGTEDYQEYLEDEEYQGEGRYWNNEKQDWSYVNAPDTTDDGVVAMCMALYQNSAPCSRHMDNYEYLELGMSQEQIEYEKRYCNFIDNIVYGAYDEQGDILLKPEQFDFSDWRNPDQYRKLKMPPGQAVGVAVSVIFFVTMLAAAVYTKRSLTRQSTPWTPKRTLDPNSLSRQNSGIVMGRSRSGPGSAPLI